MRTLALAVAFGLALAACGSEPSPTLAPPCPEGAPTPTGAQATLADAGRAIVEVHSESGEVDGSFTIELHGDEAPLATANFAALARCGFYEGITFHRVLSGFVAQAGDPQTRENRGDFEELGSGGPGYRFEIETPPEGLDYDPYAVAMANSGAPNTNGSQFFIALADLDDRLPRDYTIFGTVVEGTEVVDAIGAIPVNHPRIGVPLDPVIIDSIRIEDGA